MGKYSSESDSSDIARGRHSKHSSRNKGRSRSSSAESGHRRLQPRHKKRCKGRRSRSKERYSRSRRHGGKPKRSSSSSSSSDDSRRKNRRSPASSSSTTNSSCATPQVPPETSSQSSAEQLRAKVQRAIQAARSADNLLRQRRGEVVEIPPVVPQTNMLDEINSDGFIQRTFSSSASAPKASLPDIPLPVVVDLTEEPKLPAGSDLGVMSPVLLEDQEGQKLRWVKKLFALRQKALHGEPMVT